MISFFWYIAVALCLCAAYLDNLALGRIYGYLFVAAAILPELIMPISHIETAKDIFQHGSEYLLLNAIVIAFICLIYVLNPNVKSCMYLKKCLWGGYLLVFAYCILLIEYVADTLAFDFIEFTSMIYYLVCAYYINRGRSDGNRVSIYRYALDAIVLVRSDKKSGT